MKTKFKPGDKVYWISINNDDNNTSYIELSIDIIEEVCIDKNNNVTYWLPSCDWKVGEDSLLLYDRNMVGKYIEEHLNVNKGE